MLPAASIPHLSITADNLLRLQGADPEIVRARRPSLAALAEKAVRSASEWIQPAVWLSTLRVDGFQHNQVLLENGLRLKSELLLRHLAGAHQVAFAIGTLGGVLDDHIHQQMQSDAAWGYMLDSAGSAYADALGEWAITQVRTAAQAQSLGTSMPLMPGHTGWAVDEGQPLLFSVLRPDPAIVRLSRSAQMIPSKSFSFLIGIGCSQDDTSPCEYCSLRETCPMRH